MSSKQLNAFQKRCEDCINLSLKNGVWCCEECFGQPCTEIDDCPEGIELGEVEDIQEKAKSIKIKHGAKSEEAEKKERQPRTVKISDEKTTLFKTVSDCLSDNNFDFTVEKDNKLIIVNINGKKFKLDFIETRQKKK